MVTCNAETILGPCPFPAERTATAMCVHEHKRTGSLCTSHLEALANGSCLACWECDEPHRCPLVFFATGPVAP